jgi:hypothetical protein
MSKGLKIIFTLSVVLPIYGEMRLKGKSRDKIFGF